MTTPRIAAATMLIISLVAIVGTVSIVRSERHQQRRSVLASPTTVPAVSLFETAKPLPTYQPHSTLSLSREHTAALFIAAAVDSTSTDPGDHLTRWENEPGVQLRGQPTPEDETCLTTTLRELNDVMETTKLVRAEQHGAVEIYLLPKAQFTSVYVDVPADRTTLAVSWWDSNHRLEKVQILVDATQTPDDRCFYVRHNLLTALGFRGQPKEPLPDSFISATPPYVDAVYSPTDLELVRIMYSKFVTAGLTSKEIERRLLAPNF